MRAYIEIDGTEHPLHSIDWFASNGELAYLVATINGESVMFFNTFFNGSKLRDENLGDIGNDKIIYADLERRLKWR